MRHYVPDEIVPWLYRFETSAYETYVPKELEKNNIGIRTITSLPAIVENSVLRKSTNFNSIQRSVQTQFKSMVYEKCLFQRRLHPSSWQNVFPTNTNSNRTH